MPGFRLDLGADTATLAAHLDTLERSLEATPLSERVLLVAAEVLSNAAEHGAGAIQMEWTARVDTVVLTIRGEGPIAAQIHGAMLPDASATRGRGLFLIHTLASTVEDTEDGLRLMFI